MTSIGVKVIRSLFGAAERIAPGIGGQGGVRAVLPHSQSELQTFRRRKARGRARAASFMEEARHHRLPVGSRCVLVHEFRPPRRQGKRRHACLVLHGWRLRTEYMKALIEAYRDAGFRVMSLDLPGPRRLGRPPAQPGDRGPRGARRRGVVRSLRRDRRPFLRRRAWPSTRLPGRSSASRRSPASRLVLIAAPSSMPELFRDFGRYPQSRSAHASPRSPMRCTASPAARCEEFVGTRQLAELPVPTLVVHAPDDREVPRRPCRAFRPGRRSRHGCAGRRGSAIAVSSPTRQSWRMRWVLSPARLG